MPVKTQSSRSSSRPGTATGKKGERRVREILDAATEVLVSQGYSEFTMRRIAGQAGMKLGNLQYYFPAKSDLLRALLRDEFERCGEELRSRIGKAGSGAKARLIVGADYLLQDQEDERSCAIFWELWALASHDRDAAHVMDEYYELYCAEIESLFREINPGMGKRKAERRAALAVSMIEGLSLLRGYGKPARSNMKGIERELREVLLMLAEG